MNAIYSLVSNYGQAKDELATAVPEITAYVVFISKQIITFVSQLFFSPKKIFKYYFKKNTKKQFISTLKLNYAMFNHCKQKD